MRMEAIAGGPEIVFGDLTEADEAEDEPCERRPKQKLQRPLLQDMIGALRHLGCASSFELRFPMRA
jgi:hypothetical protein